MSRDYFSSGRDRHYDDDFNYSDNNFGPSHSRNGNSNTAPGTGRGRSRSLSRSSSRSRSIGAYDRTGGRRDNHYEETYPSYRASYGQYEYYDGPGGYYNNRDMSRTPSPVAHYPGLSHPPNEESRFGRYRAREGRNNGYAPDHNWENRSNYNHRPFYSEHSPRGRRYSPEPYFRSRSRSHSPFDYFGRDAYLRNRRSPTPQRSEYSRRASSRSRERRYYESPLDRSPGYPQRDRPWDRNEPLRRDRGRMPLRPRYDNSPPRGPIRRRFGVRRDSGNRSQLSEGELDSKSSRQPSSKSPSPCLSNVPLPNRAPGEPEQRPELQPPPPTTPVPAPPPAQSPPPPANRGPAFYPRPPQFQQNYSQFPPCFAHGRGNTFPPQSAQPNNFPPRAPPQATQSWAPMDTSRDVGFFHRPDAPRPSFHLQQYRPTYNRPPPRYAPSVSRPPPRPPSFERSGEPKQTKLNLPATNQEPPKSPDSHLPSFFPPPPPNSNIHNGSSPRHVIARPRPPPLTSYLPARRTSISLPKLPKPDFLINFEEGLYPHPWPSKLDEDFNERALELRRLRASEAEMRANLARSKFDLLLSSLEVDRLELCLTTKIADL